MIVNKSHNANSAKNNSVTPIFLNVIQFYVARGTITDSLKKFSGADFFVIAEKTIIF